MGNFRRRKLSRIGEKCFLRIARFCCAKGRHTPNLENFRVQPQNLESFPLYSTCSSLRCVQSTCCRQWLTPLRVMLVHFLNSQVRNLQTIFAMFHRKFGSFCTSPMNITQVPLITSQMEFCQFTVKAKNLCQVLSLISAVLATSTGS